MNLPKNVGSYFGVVYIDVAVDLSDRKEITWYL